MIRSTDRRMALIGVVAIATTPLSAPAQAAPAAKSAEAPAEGASAPPSKRAIKKAKKLAKKGKKLLKRKKWTKAAAAFERAVALDPQSAYVLSLGRALENEGRTLEALQRYEACADGEGGCLRGVGRIREVLGQERGEVIVTAVPSGARVRMERAGETLHGMAPFTAWAVKGQWRLHVTRSGLAPDRRVLSVPAGRTTKVAVKLRKPPAAPWTAALLQPPTVISEVAGADYGAKGKKAYAKERFSDSVAAFKLAYEADPQAKHLFNLGRSFEAVGDLPRAVGFVERYVDEATDSIQRTDGRRSLEILRRKLADEWGNVVVNTKPPGASVRLLRGDVVEAGEAPLVRWLPAGAWKLEVTAQEYLDHKAELAVGAGTSKRIDVELKPVAKPPPPTPPPIELPPPVATRTEVEDDGPSAALSWALVGSGVVLLATGGCLGWLGIEGNAEVDDLAPGSAFKDDALAKHEAAQDKLLLAHALAGAGLAAAGLGGWMLLRW